MEATAEQLMDQQIDGVIYALADPRRLTETERQAERRTIAGTVRAFQPRNPVETMLAGQCVIFDTLLRDGMHDLRMGSSGPRVVSGVLATARSFLRVFETLRRRQNPPAEKPRSQTRMAQTETDAPAPERAAEPSPANERTAAPPAARADHGIAGRIVQALPAPKRDEPPRPSCIAASPGDARPAAGSNRAQLLSGSSHAAHQSAARSVLAYAPASAARTPVHPPPDPMAGGP